MRTHEVDMPFDDPTGSGLVSITEHNDLLRVSIDKTLHGRAFGVLSHASLTEEQAVKLRDALDAWLRRNDSE